MIQNFYIKKGSELPSLIMKTTDYNYFKYSEFYSEISTAEITFSMRNVETGVLKINNKPATVKAIAPDCVDCTQEQQGYFIKYNFTKKDTQESGKFVGEFKIKFQGGIITELKGEMILPIKNTLYINIIDNI